MTEVVKFGALAHLGAPLNATFGTGRIRSTSREEGACPKKKRPAWHFQPTVQTGNPTGQTERLVRNSGAASAELHVESVSLLLVIFVLSSSHLVMSSAAGLLRDDRFCPTWKLNRISRNLAAKVMKSSSDGFYYEVSSVLLRLPSFARFLSFA